MNWVNCDLGDVLTLKRGYDLPNDKRIEGEIPVVSSSGITGFHNESKVSAPAVVTGRYGTLGEVYFVNSDCWPLNTALYVKDYKGNRPRFIYYLLQNVLSGMQSDKAAVPGVNRNDLHARKVKFPKDENLQKKIEELVTPYDDLIENNRRRIQLLEDSARLLYREWFVRLRFPGHEHVKIVEGVPEGWQAKTVEIVSEYINRGISPNYDDDGEYLVINQKCIRNRLLSLDLTRKQSKEYKEEKAVKLGDILINSTGTGTLGRVAQVWIELEKTTVDSHVTIVRPNTDVPYLWLGYTMMSLGKLLEDMGEGATNQKELNRARIREIPVILPPKPLMQDFHEFVLPVTGQIQTLLQQNKKLVEVRDLLLPRLMSGEISV